MGERSLWGKGIYFARDASYSHGFAGRDTKGRKQMLMCLVVTGVSCLGYKDMPFVSPFVDRDKRHVYNSAVDDLSNPEIFVVPEGRQAMPAYIIHYDAQQALPT